MSLKSFQELNKNFLGQKIEKSSKIKIAPFFSPSAGGTRTCDLGIIMAPHHSVEQHLE
jgi:hypothetical protein